MESQYFMVFRFLDLKTALRVLAASAKSGVFLAIHGLYIGP
jgi:hypothetical protein